MKKNEYSEPHWSASKQVCVQYLQEPPMVRTILHEPVHKISNNVVCATSKDSDQPAYTRSLIRAFASRLSIL